MSGLRLYWLDPNQPGSDFPDPALALDEPNGLLAMGGDLSPERLRRAYASGIFPWYNPDESILWWCPNPRTVLPTNRIHISRRFRRTLDKADYAVTLDQDFAGVIACCAGERRGNPGTWLGPEMRAAYTQLHAEGDAHSIEVWREGRLIGGLYGLAQGRMFYGESMFSRDRDASKIALAWLARQLRAWDFPLIDGQVGSGHLYRMGAIDLPRRDFLRIIEATRGQAAPASPWRFELAAPQAAAHLPAAARPGCDDI
ncbi:MAG: leucyl/phenylalanyl-tRNA--protein transferase [Salinisphaera sp.]|jgi:leucyl/phenylalanyl-tRNA--protein transferase|nr:leucyl/phenylalanyl-tRNA--protein transferase [Salinisphaera sp.]